MEMASQLIGGQTEDQQQYTLLVTKPPGLMCDYIVSISRSHAALLADWYTPAQRQRAWMVEFYDLQALYDLHQRSRFDIYTPMHYSASELEHFFVAGLGKIIREFIGNQQYPILFWAATRPALGRYYNYLLKKYAIGLDCHYRTDIQKEVGLYVIETQWNPVPSGQTPFLARGRPVTALPAVTA